MSKKINMCNTKSVNGIPLKKVMPKEKAIYFFQYLPPWRIDVFNELSKSFKLTIVFWNAECSGFTYDRKGLLARLDADIETVFLSNGINMGTHSIRKGVFDIISRINPQVVFSHEYAPISFQCVLYKKIRHLDFKLVVTTSDNLEMAMSVGVVKKIVRRLILKNADGVVLYSKSVEKWYNQTFPWLKTDVCPNIQNPKSLLQFETSFDGMMEAYRKKYNLSNEKIILYVGRLEGVKGLDLMISAFSRINNNCWRIVIVGNGKERNNLQIQADSLNMHEKIVFVDFCFGADLYVWYRIANFFILPSRYEPFGAVVNEALVFGCPVMASKYIGALDFINEKNGLIFDPLSNEDFEEKMQCAMNKFGVRFLTNKDLMVVDFEKSVQAFKRILE